MQGVQDNKTFRSFTSWSGSVTAIIGFFFGIIVWGKVMVIASPILNWQYHSGTDFHLKGMVLHEHKSIWLGFFHFITIRQSQQDSPTVSNHHLSRFTFYFLLFMRYNYTLVLVSSQQLSSPFNDWLLWRTPSELSSQPTSTELKHYRVFSLIFLTAGKST